MATETIEDGYRVITHGNGAVERLLINEQTTPPVLSVTLDQVQVAAGVQVMATAEVRDEGGDIVAISGTYFVPVQRRSDNLQVRFLQVDLVDGQATVDFDISEPGVYVLRLDDVEPTPQSRLGSNPKLIVTEG